MTMIPPARSGSETPEAGSSLPFWLLGSFGVAVRLIPYAANRSLWFDEALLALNLIDRPLWALAGRLDFNQAAPIGFLWLTKLSAMALGPGERALRLVPLLSGLASLVLFFVLARRILERRAAIVACAVFVLSQPLVYYASELKQYSGDVLAALAITWAAIRCREKASPGAHAWLAVIGLAALFFSHPAAFVMASVWAALLIEAIRLGRRGSIRLLAATGVVWTAAVVFDEIVFLRRLTGSAYYRRFFGQLGGFLPDSPREAPKWFLYRALSLLHETAGIPLAGLGLLCVVVGVAVWWRRERVQIFFWLGPLALAGIAACLRVYPLVARTTLFAVPAVALLLGEGAEEVRRRSGGTGGVPYVALITLLFAQPAAWSLRVLVRPPAREQIRPVLRRIARERRTGDAFYVYSAAQYALRYYIETRSIPFSGELARAVLEPAATQSLEATWFPKALRSAPPEFFVGEPHPHRKDAYGAELEELRGRPRVWVIFSHLAAGGGVDERRLIVGQLDRMGRRIESFGGAGAGAYLYDLRGEGEPAARSRSTAPILATEGLQPGVPGREVGIR
jgi:Dolichyl-phosphate-mannose-protein mannosyltransferase